MSLVAILDADKEGFLRSERSLIQTIGRAARNSNGQVIMYADELTESMEKAIDETNRRRTIQKEYNKEHGITPQTINKGIRELIKASIVEDVNSKYGINKDESVEEMIAKLTDEMLKCAADMEFEKAAELRDKIKELRESTGMNRKEFCEYFGIPYRTVTEWERGTRKMPDYVFRLLAYRIKMENFAEKEEVDEE